MVAIYCPMRNSDEMTTEKTQPTLYFLKYYDLRTSYFGLVSDMPFSKITIGIKTYFFTDIFYANIMHVLSKLIY